MRKTKIIAVICFLLMAPWGFGLAEDLEENKPAGSFSEKFQPRIGLLAGLTFPAGDVGSVMKAGFGGSVFVDISIPLSFLSKSGLVLRSGVSLGYTSVGSENTSFDARVSIVPIVAYVDLGYPLKFGLVPSFRVGFGGSSVSLKDKSGGGNDLSSFDATLQIGAAFAYKPFEQIEFLLNTGYAILFEEVNGNFFYLSLGAAYRL